MAFSEFKQKLGAFNTSHLQYVEKQKTLRDSTMWDDSTASGDNNKHVYAVLPPIEYFMNLPPNIKKQHFFQSISCADCFIGEVSAIQANGLILKLLCMEDQLARDLDHTNVAVVPLKSLPAYESRGDPLAAFQLQDRVRAVIVDIDGPTHRIWASMNPVSLRSHQLDVKLGLINDDELPQHYREMINVNNKSYEECLKDSSQFNNKGGVDRLCAKLGIDVLAPLSLMHAVNKLEIQPHQLAEEMRKKQTYKLALKHVAKGVGYFREKKHTEAMQCFNYALSVDKNHVEGLVARGALYATLSSFKKAMEDLELALEVEPTHKDAANYLAQVLVVYGRQRMDGESMDASEAYFQRALKLNPWMEEAKDAMIELRARKLEKLKPKVLKPETRTKSSALPTSEMKRAHDTLLEIMRSDQESSKPPDPKSMWEEDEKAAGRMGQNSLKKPPFSVPTHEDLPAKDAKELPREPVRSPISRRELDPSQMSRREPVFNRESDRSPMSRREPLSNREPDLSQLPRREPVFNREPDRDRSPMSRREPISNREPDLFQASRQEPDFNREPGRSQPSRRKYDRSPSEYDRSPQTSRRKLDQSPMSRRDYDQSPMSRRDYDRSPMSRRDYDRSSMSRREYDRSPISRRKQDQSPVYRREDKQPSYRKHDRSPSSPDDYPRSRDSYKSSLSRHGRHRSPIPPDPYRSMPDRDGIRLSGHESSVSRKQLLSVSPYSNPPISPYSQKALSRSPSRHEIPLTSHPIPPGPSAPAQVDKKIRDSAYDPANPSDTNFFIYAEQDGLFQAMKGNKALASDDMDNRFLIVKNSFSVTKPAQPKPPPGPRFMTPNSPDPLPAPPLPPPSLTIGQPAFGQTSVRQSSNEQPTFGPPVGQTSFGWLRTKAKPSTSAALMKPKPVVEAVKPPVEAAPAAGNPFVASIDTTEQEAAASRHARSHPFLRRAKAPPAPVQAGNKPSDFPAEDSKRLVVEVNASEEGEHRRIIKRRSPADRKYRRRSISPSARSRSRSYSPADFGAMPRLVSGNDEHAKMVNAFLSKLSARDQREARVRDRVKDSREHSGDRSSRGMYDSPRRERSLASRHKRDGDSPRNDRSRRRGSPGDDLPRRKRDSRDDRSRERDSHRDDRSRGRDRYRDDRSRERDRHPDNWSRGRDSHPDDWSRGRDSHREDRYKRRGSPRDDWSSRRDRSRDDWPKDRPQRNRAFSPWSQSFDEKQKAGQPKDKKEGRSGDKQTSVKMKVDPGEGEAKAKGDSSKTAASKTKLPSNEQSKTKSQKEVSKEESKSRDGSSKDDASKGRGVGDTTDIIEEDIEVGSHQDAASRGRGAWRAGWRGRGRGEWRGRGRGTEEWRGRGRGEWRGRGLGYDDWRGRGRGEWRGRGSEEWRGRGRGNEEWRGRGRGNEDWRGRGRGNEDWRGRGRGMEEWRGRGSGEWRGRGRGFEDGGGRGRGHGYWRGNTSYSSLDDWRKKEESFENVWKTEQPAAVAEDRGEHGKKGKDDLKQEKQENKSRKSPTDDDDPDAEDVKSGGRRKLFLPSAIDLRNVTTGAPVPSPPRPLNWSPKRWASVQKKIRAIEARKTRQGSYSPWQSPERTPQDKEYTMITRGHSPKPGGSKFPSTLSDPTSLPHSRTPSHRTGGPADPDSPEKVKADDVEMKEVEPSTSTKAELQTKEMGTATSKGKLINKKVPTRSLAQMETFMKELKAKSKP